MEKLREEFRKEFKQGTTYIFSAELSKKIGIRENEEVIDELDGREIIYKQSNMGVCIDSEGYKWTVYPFECIEDVSKDKHDDKKEAEERKLLIKKLIIDHMLSKGTKELVEPVKVQDKIYIVSVEEYIPTDKQIENMGKVL